MQVRSGFPSPFSLLHETRVLQQFRVQQQPQPCQQCFLQPLDMEQQAERLDSFDCFSEAEIWELDEHLDACLVVDEWISPDEMPAIEKHEEIRHWMDIKSENASLLVFIRDQEIFHPSPIDVKEQEDNVHVSVSVAPLLQQDVKMGIKSVVNAKGGGSHSDLAIPGPSPTVSPSCWSSMLIIQV